MPASFRRPGGVGFHRRVVATWLRSAGASDETVIPSPEPRRDHARLNAGRRRRGGPAARPPQREGALRLSLTGDQPGSIPAARCGGTSGTLATIAGPYRRKRHKPHQTNPRPSYRRGSGRRTRRTDRAAQLDCHRRRCNLLTSGEGACSAESGPWCGRPPMTAQCQGLLT